MADSSESQPKPPAGDAEPARQQLEARLQEALAERRRAEGDLRDFVENAVEGLHSAAPDGTILWANQAELDMFGYPRSEYYGRSVASFHVDGERIAEMQRRLARGETARNFESEVRCKDGSVKQVVLNANGLWEDGRFVRSRCFTWDVTQWRAVTEASDRLVAIVTSSEDAIVSKDLTGRIMTWNAAAERIFGYSAAEAVGRSIHLIIPTDRRSEEDVVLERIRRGEQVDHFETVRRRKDGTFVEVSLTISPIRDSAGRIVGASKIARDVSDRKRIEADRERLLVRAEQARAEAERANRVKDEFLATLSHELRSPLNAIHGWARLAAGHLTEQGPSMIRRALEVIDRNVALQLRLITDLLDVSRFTNGKLPIQRERVDVVGIVGRVMDSLRPDASAKRIHVSPRIRTGQAFVSGDASRLEQVLWNVLSNALKFTPQGGAVTITVESTEDDVEIAVADTGEGISPEFLPQVFDRFRQADSTTTRRHGGLGLGLAVAHHLVEAHGGHITAESPGPGQGSTFRIRLPLADATSTVEIEPATFTVNLDGLRVLVTDDDADARELMGSLLRPHGAYVTSVGSTHAALNALEHERFDVLLSDLAMPDQDGYELIEAVRHDPRPYVRDLRAIAVSAYADDLHRSRAFAAGFDDYLTKPLEPSKLLRLLVEATGGPSRHGADEPSGNSLHKDR
jgi:PAS domain S-box-containing protein